MSPEEASQQVRARINADTLAALYRYVNAEPVRFDSYGAPVYEWAEDATTR